eukprot:3016566-Alexandrium_andersonii.AAC.1
MPTSLQAFEPGIARARKRPQHRFLKLSEMPNLPMKRTGGCAGGTSRGWSGGGSPRGEQPGVRG